MAGKRRKVRLGSELKPWEIIVLPDGRFDLVSHHHHQIVDSNGNHLGPSMVYSYLLAMLHMTHEEFLAHEFPIHKEAPEETAPSAAATCRGGDLGAGNVFVDENRLIVVIGQAGQRTFQFVNEDKHEPVTDDEPMTLDALLFMLHLTVDEFNGHEFELHVIQ